MNTKIMKIEKIDNYGRGITYYDDKIMFVKNALPEEEVTIKNINFKKKYYESETDEIKKEVITRVVPKCPFYEVCGGCNIMHMNTEEQQKFKLNKVKDILKKYANLDIEVRLVENDKQLFFRNKLTLKVKDNNFGYYNESSHNFISIDYCLLASQEINEVIKNHDYINILDGEIVIRSNKDKELLISITSQENIEIHEDKIPNNIKGIIINDKTIYGDNYFYDYISDMKFKVSYNSFFQVNNYMAGRIFEILKNNLKGKNLLDLYCGVGTLGLAVAKNYKNIYGIEIIENAIEDAKLNAEYNNLKNTKYYVGSTEKVLKNIDTKFDTIIVDPPRSGLNTKTIEDILNIRPKTIAYVSCDPMTFARDLKILNEYYEITKVNALDMFPNSYHVECITIMERK